MAQKQAFGIQVPNDGVCCKNETEQKRNQVLAFKHRQKVPRILDQITNRQPENNHEEITELYVKNNIYA